MWKRLSKYKRTFSFLIRALPLLLCAIAGMRYFVTNESNLKRYERKTDELRDWSVRINRRLDSHEQRFLVMKNEIDDRVSLGYYRRNEDIIKNDFRENDTLRTRRFQTITMILNAVSQKAAKNAGEIDQLNTRLLICFPEFTTKRK